MHFLLSHTKLHGHKRQNDLVSTCLPTRNMTTCIFCCHTQNHLAINNNDQLSTSIPTCNVTACIFRYHTQNHSADKCEWRKNLVVHQIRLHNRRCCRKPRVGILINANHSIVLNCSTYRNELPTKQRENKQLIS